MRTGQQDGGRVVSIRTRVGYRVRQFFQARLLRFASFNPHPGWLPGETALDPALNRLVVGFNPHPGWLPGETSSPRTELRR